MNRRSFLRGLVAGAAGLLLPAEVAAEPERRVWALDSTMLRPRTLYWGFFDKDRPELGVGPCLTPDEPMTVEHIEATMRDLWAALTPLPRKMTIGGFPTADETGLLTVDDLHRALSDVWDLAEPLPRTVYASPAQMEETSHDRVLTVDDVYAPWANDPVFMREYLRATRELEAAILRNRELPWSDFVRRE